MKLEVRYPGSLRRRPPGSPTEHSTPIPGGEYQESSTTMVVLSTSGVENPAHIRIICAEKLWQMLDLAEKCSKMLYLTYKKSK